MPIKAVVLDLSGTLIDDSGAIVVGVPDMITRLQQLGLTIYIASNNAVPSHQVNRFSHVEMLDRFIVGGTKGSRKFIDTVCSRLGIARNQLLYLGDTDNDMREAVNCDVIFFLAAWSAPNYAYGIEVNTPARFAEIVETFFLKEKLWYYYLDDTDSGGRSVIVRALLEANTAWNTNIGSLLKYNLDLETVRSFKPSEYFSLHLLASLYLEGLHLRPQSQKPAIWCVYPGHAGGHIAALDEFARLVSRLFHQQYEASLIRRHTPARKRSTARSQREVPSPSIDEQFQTILLDPALQTKIADRRVLVFDDFTTEGQSFETARNFLLNAQAAEIISIAVAKYGTRYRSYYPNANLRWDSFTQVKLRETDFYAKNLVGTLDQDALQPFSITRC